jgi:hypothetical protein
VRRKAHAAVTFDANETGAAYETAQASMTDIMNSSSTMPNNIQMAVKWVVQGTQDQMKAQVPNYIKYVCSSDYWSL